MHGNARHATRTDNHRFSHENASFYASYHTTGKESLQEQRLPLTQPIRFDELYNLNFLVSSASSSASPERRRDAAAISCVEADCSSVAAETL